HHALAEADAGHLVLALGDAHARRLGSEDIGAALGIEQSRRAQPLGEGLAVAAVAGHARIGAAVVDLALHCSATALDPYGHPLPLGRTGAHGPSVRSHSGTSGSGLGAAIRPWRDRLRARPGSRSVCS